MTPIKQGPISLDQSGQATTLPVTSSSRYHSLRACPRILSNPTWWSSPIPAHPPQPPTAGQTASFRTYTIGIVTHGGIQDPSWKYGPPWELETARLMKQEGYDAVIPYNWVAQERHAR